MRLLVTGSAGQVGHALAALARQRRIDVRAYDRAALDVTDADAVDHAVAGAAGSGPLAVVNCAAYTAVDRAESEPEASFAVNRDGAAHLAAACDRHGAALVHVSTDYVFDGRRDEPYHEGDPVNPLSVYGESKWAGEEAVRQRLERHAIVRTAWVFSARGRNFVRTIARLLRERDEVRVVADQTGHPTWAGHLAEGLLTIGSGLASGGATGTFHLAGTPPTSWYGLAQAVLQEVRLPASRQRPTLLPISTEAYPTAARRPRCVLLSMERVRKHYISQDVEWAGGLPHALRSIPTYVDE